MDTAQESHAACLGKCNEQPQDSGIPDNSANSSKLPSALINFANAPAVFCSNSDTCETSREDKEAHKNRTGYECKENAIYVPLAGARPCKGHPSTEKDPHFVHEGHREVNLQIIPQISILIQVPKHQETITDLSAKKQQRQCEKVDVHKMQTGKGHELQKYQCKTKSHFEEDKEIQNSRKVAMLTETEENISTIKAPKRNNIVRVSKKNRCPKKWKRLQKMRNKVSAPKTAQEDHVQRITTKDKAPKQWQYQPKRERKLQQQDAQKGAYSTDDEEYQKPPETEVQLSSEKLVLAESCPKHGEENEIPTEGEFSSEKVIPAETCPEDGEENETPTEDELSSAKLVPAETCPDDGEENETPTEDELSSAKLVPVEPCPEDDEENETPTEDELSSKKLVPAEPCPEDGEENETPMEDELSPEKLVPAEPCPEDGEENEVPTEDELSSKKLVPAESCPEDGEENETPMEDEFSPEKLVPAESCPEDGEENETPMEDELSSEKLIPANQCLEYGEESQALTEMESQLYYKEDVPAGLYTEDGKENQNTGGISMPKKMENVNQCKRHAAIESHAECQEASRYLSGKIMLSGESPNESPIATETEKQAPIERGAISEQLSMGEVIYTRKDASACSFTPEGESAQVSKRDDLISSNKDHNQENIFSQQGGSEILHPEFKRDTTTTERKPDHASHAEELNKSSHHGKNENFPQEIKGANIGTNASQSRGFLMLKDGDLEFHAKMEPEFCVMLNYTKRMLKTKTSVQEKIPGKFFSFKASRRTDSLKQ